MDETNELRKWIDDKCEKINEELCNFFESEEAKKRIHSMNVYPIFIKILKTDNDKNISSRKFDNYEDILYCLDKFQDIVADINMKVNFVPEIENFCSFIGWTSRIYKKMSSETDEDMKEAMRLVNDYIVGCGFYAGLVGIQRGNLTKFKMQVAGDNGQGMVTQKEFNNQNKADKKLASKEELLKNLQQMRMLPSDEEETEKDKSKQ